MKNRVKKRYLILTENNFSRNKNQKKRLFGKIITLRAGQ